MAEDRKQRRSLMESVKAPLIFSAALGLVAAAVTTIAASGGTANPTHSHRIARVPSRPSVLIHQSTGR